MNDPSTLIVPVESQVRELDAKLLLACAAAERGFPVVIGSRAYIHYHVSSLPRGVYLAKSMRRLSERMFGILRRLGHEIVAFDEEGLVRLPDPEYFSHRLSGEAMGQVSHLLAWGPDDARAFRKFPGYTGVPIHMTGNPRIDLLRPELRACLAEEAAKLRQRFGDFVLLNTNFGRLNHFFPKLSDMRPNLTGDAGDLLAVRARHRDALFARFRELVPVIADAFPAHTLVVRPHPSEGHAVWRDAAAGRRNVVVLNEGNVVPWLLASRALVHNGCTTAVQAQLLGATVLTYRPLVCERFDDPLPNGLGHPAFDEPELLELLDASLAGRLGPANGVGTAKLLEAHVVALDGPLASDRMVDVLEGAGYLDNPPPAPGRGPYAQAWAHNQLRTVVKRVNMRRPNHRNNHEYHRHRFPAVSLDALEGRIARFGAELGRFAGVRASQISQHVFRIESR